MYWKKLGRVFEVENIHPLMTGHAANPLPVFLHDNIYRIFYSSRDSENRSSVSYIDFDIITLQIIYIHPVPVFTYGNENSFYSHGVSIGNLYSVDKIDYILFMGWQNPKNQHWRGDIGRLRLENKANLILDPEKPFMQLDDEDPVSLSYPFVVFHDDLFKMWYGSTITWETANGEMLHVIKYATSKDGVTWQKQGVAIPYKVGVAQAFSRPTVLIDESGYSMWFSYRSGSGTSYRIGYATSKDGINWENKNKDAGIDISPEGWDSEMICYPFVFEHLGKRYLLYNGNGYGKTGFGIAVFSKSNK